MSGRVGGRGGGGGARARRGGRGGLPPVLAGRQRARATLAVAAAVLLLNHACERDKLCYEAGHYKFTVISQVQRYFTYRKTVQYCIQDGATADFESTKSGERKLEPMSRVALRSKSSLTGLHLGKGEGSLNI